MDEAKRDYLARYKPYAMQIKRLQQRLNKVDGILSNTNGLVFKGVGEYGKQRMVRDYQLQHDELGVRIKKLQSEAEPIKQEILTSITCLHNPDWANALTLRFIDCLSFDEIQSRLYVAPRTVTRWYRAGIDDIKLPVYCNSMNYIRLNIRDRMVFK